MSTAEFFRGGISMSQATQPTVQELLQQVEAQFRVAMGVFAEVLAAAADAIIRVRKVLAQQQEQASSGKATGLFSEDRVAKLQDNLAALSQLDKVQAAAVRATKVCNNFLDADPETRLSIANQFPTRPSISGLQAPPSSSVPSKG